MTLCIFEIIVKKLFATTNIVDFARVDHILLNILGLGANAFVSLFYCIHSIIFEITLLIKQSILYFEHLALHLNSKQAPQHFSNGFIRTIGIGVIIFNVVFR